MAHHLNASAVKIPRLCKNQAKRIGICWKKFAVVVARRGRSLSIAIRAGSSLMPAVMPPKASSPKIWFKIPLSSSFVAWPVFVETPALKLSSL